MGRNIAIQSARQEKNMTQTELAKQVGVSRQTLNAIELGEHNPSLKICKRICKALGRTLDQLFWLDYD